MRHHTVKILGAPAELSLTGSFQFRAKTKRLPYGLIFYFSCIL
jgi:hypothetical protein